MASSEVEIANSALIKIGEATIASLDDANKKAARVAKRQLPLQRKALIRRARWNFAMARISLAPDGTTPAFGFDNRFALPEGCLRVIGLFDENELQRNYTADRDPWKVEGGFILADGTEIKIFYLRDITDVSLFDPLFAECLAWKLAADLAYDLSSGSDIVSLAQKGFEETFKQARHSDAIEGTPEHIESSEWVDSRLHTSPLRAGPIVY